MIPELHESKSPHTRFRDLAASHDHGKLHPEIRIQISVHARSTMIKGSRMPPTSEVPTLAIDC